MTQCRNVLIVEDDLSIQKSLRLAIECEGYKVFTAGNGKEGLDLFPTIEKPCVILLDLMMPVMDGFEFLEMRKLNQPLSQVPVVIVSAFLEKAKEVKADGYVKKPVQLDDLFVLIKKHCEQFTGQAR
jgi:CheY-like chemotaxis protein